VIVFIGTGGRLGNQIFQTAFLEGIRRKNETIVTTRMGEAQGLFRGLRRYFNSNNYFVRKAADKVLRPFMEQFLVKTRIVTGYVEIQEKMRITRGVLPLRYCSGYFQSESAFERSGLSRERIRRSFRNEAEDLLRRAGSAVPLFVHVRRGDHAVPGIQGSYTPLLPREYYRSCISRLLQEVERPYFFFVGDDPQWCEKEFEDVPNKTIVRGSPYGDIALMMLCNGGVTSNSSFAWCGAYLCNRSAPIYAPRFWLGWSKREWHPRSVAYEGFRFVDVHEALQSSR
jgi:Glycosyl transferase family 11